MKSKHCEWCDHNFETKISYQIYCSAECREAATKEKIAQRYIQNKAKSRVGKERRCKSCNALLSIYNDDQVCNSCIVNPSEIEKALKEMKGFMNGKD